MCEISGPVECSVGINFLVPATGSGARHFLLSDSEPAAYIVRLNRYLVTAFCNNSFGVSAAGGTNETHLRRVFFNTSTF